MASDEKQVTARRYASEDKVLELEAQIDRLHQQVAHMALREDAVNRATNRIVESIGELPLRDRLCRGNYMCPFCAIRELLEAVFNP
jgi:hypothetical protein